MFEQRSKYESQFFRASLASLDQGRNQTPERPTIEKHFVVIVIVVIIIVFVFSTGFKGIGSEKLGRNHSKKTESR
jgi:hypothetical protein